jgi:hypothetical protein
VCPTGKVVFVTKADAQAALGRMAAHRTNMRAFRCAWCEKFHVGHRRGAIL